MSMDIEQYLLHQIEIKDEEIRRLQTFNFDLMNAIAGLKVGIEEGSDRAKSGIAAARDYGEEQCHAN